jgi:hypothetical protein
MPPRPIAFASIAAQRRTPRSSSSVSIPRYFFRSVSVKAASCIQRNVADHGDSTQDILDILFPCNALANEGGGKIILGVTNDRPRKVVGSKAFDQPERTRKGLCERIPLAIDFEEINHPDCRS